MVLGIEEAREDPSLTPSPAGEGGSANGGGAGTTGGSTAGSGSGGTSSTGGSPPTGGSDNGGSGGGGGPSLCEQYCAEVVPNCDPEGTAEPPLKQFADVEQCLAACALFPPGEPGVRGVNTIECRLISARSAQSEPMFACPAAGPAPGADGCGSPCEAYCTLMMGACTEQSTSGTEGYFFEDLEACMEACALVPDTQPYVFDYDPDLITGDHLACRTYHAVVATQGDFEHCDHAIGGSLCVP